MNRGQKSGAVAKKWLVRAEKELARCGYYEDELIMVVEMNYTDMPQEWFKQSGLEEERIDDKDKLSIAAYEHKWLGKYLDTVDNAIIKPEWFDAAVDAHKIERLKKVFEPHGAIIAAHDPSDSGSDAKGFSLRHGSIIKLAKEKTTGEIDEGCDWATDLAVKHGADWFVWDGDGMGTGLKRQVSDAFAGKHTKYHMFRGSLSGSGQDNADKIYQPQDGDSDSDAKAKTYSDTFLNNRAQYHITIADMFYNTYKCVVRGEYIDPIEMISIDSEGVDNLQGLRTEACSIPLISNRRELIQVAGKKEMKSLGIDSPNVFESIMMSLFSPSIKSKPKKLNFTSEF